MPTPSILTFDAPEVSPKHYIVKGPSGWTETYSRKEADAKLEKFIYPLPIDELVETFLMARSVAETKDVMGWYTITGFLSRTMGCGATGIPHDVAIAFWGRVVLARQTKDAN